MSITIPEGVELNNKGIIAQIEDENEKIKNSKFKFTREDLINSIEKYYN